MSGTRTPASAPSHGPASLGFVVVAVAAIVGAWWCLSLAIGGRLVPDPPSVFRRFVVLLPGILGASVLVSLARVGAALAAALLTAVPLGVLLGRNRLLDRVLSPIAYLSYPVPKIALLPVIMLLFGLGEWAKGIVIFLVLFFQTLVTVRDAARAVPEPYVLSIRSLGATRPQVWRYVLWPALLPSLLSSLRIGTGTALAVLFFAETFGTTVGLGWFVMESWMRMSYVDLYAGILCLALLGLALFLAIDLIQRWSCRWQAAPP
ncbi:MAG TPA: ABC transporter permease subunit [Spirochaetia bacterium]|nr:ABC transporter permease subunit [Spirochaetia bacterium]